MQSNTIYIHFAVMCVLYIALLCCVNRYECYHSKVKAELIFQPFDAY